jgi:hypothetical protein
VITLISFGTALYYIGKPAKTVGNSPLALGLRTSQVSVVLPWLRRVEKTIPFQFYKKNMRNVNF